MDSPSSFAYPSVPLPPHLRHDLPDPTIPWKISDRLISLMSQQSGVAFKKVEVLPSDPEWRFIWRYFHHDKPTNYDIAHVYCLHERHQVQAFELNLSAQEREADKFSPTWQGEPRADQRARAIERWKKAADPFSPFQTMENDGRRRTWEKTKVLPLWHGSSREVCGSVGESGFTFFGKKSLGAKGASDPSSTDDGFFGSGIYFTNSARYAADIYSMGHLLLAWVSMREPFPVVGDSAQQDMALLRGHGAYKHYNAHYVPVHPKTKTRTCALYYPCQPGESAYCDEIVVFHKTQAIPRFWVVLQPSILHVIQVGHDEPDCVEELMPHVLAMLQHPAVDKNQKARNALNSALEKLMLLPSDDYLEDHGLDNLYGKLQHLLAAGKVNKAVAKTLLQPSLPSAGSGGASGASGAAAVATAPAVPAPKAYDEDLALTQALSASLTTGAAKPKPAAPAAAPKVAKSPLPQIAFGAAHWAKYFGDVGAEPPIPTDILASLKAECPFWPGKRVEETHLLTLIPATVDGRPFCLDLLGELIQHPKTGHSTKYASYWGTLNFSKINLGKLKAQIGQQSPGKSYWVLMTRDELEGTRYNNYKDQCAILDKQRKDQPYEPPGILEAATVILMEHAQSGAYLFETGTHTFCREQIFGLQGFVGGFGAAGLDIDGCLRGYHGLAAVRKF